VIYKNVSLSGLLALLGYCFMSDTSHDNVNYNSSFKLPRIIAKQERGEVLTSEELAFAKRIGLRSTMTTADLERITKDVANLAK
jgi:hypothetical protein